MRRIIVTAALTAICTTAAWADDKLDAAVGGAAGGAVGAVVGQEIGDRNGAIIGSAVGAAVGTAIATDGHDGGHRTESAPVHVRVEADTEAPHHSGYFCPPGQARKGRC